MNNCQNAQTKTNTTGAKIGNLTGIRFYLFIIVFLRHFDWINQKYSILPSYHTLHLVFFAVTFFFVLSGFCIALGYGEKFLQISKDTIINFYKKRIIKIYPLYLITGLIFLIFWFKPIDPNWLTNFLRYYVPMISPNDGNGAAWFIDVLFFCYLLMPFVGYLIHKLEKLISKYLNINSNCLLLVLLSIFWAISTISVILSPNENSQKLYSFRYIRFLQFLIGYILGLLYNNANFNKNNECFIIKNKNMFDAILLIIVIFMVYFIGASNWHTTLILDYTLYIPLVCLSILYLCINSKSILNKFFESKFSMYLANISMEAYLIHYIFIQFTSKFMVVNKKSEIIIMFTTLLGLTILCSIGYKNLYNKIAILIKNK